MAVINGELSVSSGRQRIVLPEDQKIDAILFIGHGHYGTALPPFFCDAIGFGIADKNLNQISSSVCGGLTLGAAPPTPVASGSYDSITEALVLCRTSSAIYSRTGAFSLTVVEIVDNEFEVECSGEAEWIGYVAICGVPNCELRIFQSRASAGTTTLTTTFRPSAALSLMAFYDDSYGSSAPYYPLGSVEIGSWDGGLTGATGGVNQHCQMAAGGPATGPTLSSSRSSQWLTNTDTMYVSAVSDTSLTLTQNSATAGGGHNVGILIMGGVEAKNFVWDVTTADIPESSRTGWGIKPNGVIYSAALLGSYADSLMVGGSRSDTGDSTDVSVGVYSSLTGAAATMYVTDPAAIKQDTPYTAAMRFFTKSFDTDGLTISFDFDGDGYRDGYTGTELGGYVNMFAFTLFPEEIDANGSLPILGVG
jgi:hypothetical protein